MISKFLKKKQPTSPSNLSNFSLSLSPKSIYKKEHTVYVLAIELTYFIHYNSFIFNKIIKKIILHYEPFNQFLHFKISILVNIIIHI